MPLLRAKRRLAGWKRDAEQRWYETRLERPIDVPHCWARGPSDATSSECCFFVTYLPGRHVADHVVAHARAWYEIGFAVTLIVCADQPTSLKIRPDLDFCSAILVRQNRGYDFGGWASAICLTPGLSKARRLVTVNDSIYGPMRGFENMVARLRMSQADICGPLGSTQFRPHLQSFLLQFHEHILTHPFFWRFWRGVRVGNRQFVIRTCELDLLQRASAAGLTSEILFPHVATHPIPNRTLTDWRMLVEEGFPYIKAQLLRDNPFDADITDWRAFAREHGYDAALIDAHLVRSSGS